MGKTTVECSRCGHKFKPSKLSETAGGVTLGGLGGAAGTSAGVAAFGTAIAATGPLALAGAAAGVALGSQFTRCPECDRIQRK